MYCTCGISLGKSISHRGPSMKLHLLWAMVYLVAGIQKAERPWDDAEIHIAKQSYRIKLSSTLIRPNIWFALPCKCINRYLYFIYSKIAARKRTKHAYVLSYLFGLGTCSRCDKSVKLFPMPCNGVLKFVWLWIIQWLRQRAHKSIDCNPMVMTTWEIYVSNALATNAVSSSFSCGILISRFFLLFRNKICSFIGSKILFWLRTHCIEMSIHELV